MQPVPNADTLVSLVVLRQLGDDGHDSDGQLDCCVCNCNGATLLRLQLADLVALVVRRRLNGNRRMSPADTALVHLPQQWCGDVTAGVGVLPSCCAWILLQQILGSGGSVSCCCAINVGRCGSDN